MTHLNKVILSGRVTFIDPVKEISSDLSVCKIGLALSHRSKDNNKAQFFEVVTWNGTAKACNQYLSKGSEVLIEGFLSKKSWDKEGKKFYKTEIHAQSVHFLSKPQKKENDASPAESSDESNQ